MCPPGQRSRRAGRGGPGSPRARPQPGRRQPPRAQNSPPDRSGAGREEASRIGQGEAALRGTVSASSARRMRSNSAARASTESSGRAGGPPERARAGDCSAARAIRCQRSTLPAARSASTRTTLRALERQNLGGAHLRGLLHRPVHLLALQESERQRNMGARLACGRAPLYSARRCAPGRYLHEDRLALAPPPIQDADARPGRETEHPRDLVCLLGRERHLIATNLAGLDEKTMHGPYVLAAAAPAGRATMATHSASRRTRSTRNPAEVSPASTSSARSAGMPAPT